jgi:hypothetical protein
MWQGSPFFWWVWHMFWSILEKEERTQSEVNYCPSINGLFAQSMRYAQKIILKISTIFLRLFFFACLDLEQKSSFMDGHEKC